MSIDLTNLKQRFQEIYDRPAEGGVRAPGRVNLIGEHTDYNSGYVLPIAIERETVALYARRKDTVVTFRTMQEGEPAQIDLSDEEKIVPGEPGWANYCRGVAKFLLEAPVPLRGADILFESNVPLGGGLSSSASLEVAAAMAMMASSKTLGWIEDIELAQAAQKAEHEFAGAPCGLMDQAICIFGQENRALLMDCRDNSMEQIPFDDPEVVLLVADTQVKHEINDGGYAARREQCYNACDVLGVHSLREADMAMIDSADSDNRLGGEELKRAIHVVGEIERTLQAADALRNRDHKKFGQLMIASHASLRDNYDVSCKELDFIVDIACNQEGVFGARMTGGGFGGCAIALVKADRAQQLGEYIAHSYGEKFGQRCPVFATRAAQGAGLLDF